MIFKKDKIYIEAFTRMTFGDIIKLPIPTYVEYLDTDLQKVLTENEFTLFSSQLLCLRLLLLYSEFLQKKLEGKIKLDDEYLGHIQGKALYLAFTDNNYSKEDIETLINKFLFEIENLCNYLEQIQRVEILEKGYSYHICMFFSERFKTIVTKENYEENINKYSIIISYINNNKKIVNQYFEYIYRKVKLLY